MNRPPIPHNVQELPRPVYSPRGLPLLLSTRWGEFTRPIVTVEAYMKWYGLVVVGDGATREVSFPESDHLTPYIDHAPNPHVVKGWAEDQGYELEELALEMMIGRWELARYGNAYDPSHPDR